MSRIVFVNGQYLSEEDAKVSIFDRGFLFADAVYEVTSVLNGKLIDFNGHVKRLDRSLSELDMDAPCNPDELLEIHYEILKRNNLKEGLIYLQVSRGSADRDFLYPQNTTPTLVLFSQAKNLTDPPSVIKGIQVITVPDLRWHRRDIKTVQLLYPSMAKMMAQKQGADDAWMFEDGFITEGTSNNAFILTNEDRIITRHLSNDILHGITRSALLRFTDEIGLAIEQRPFTVGEALEAKEAFITSASGFVTPVVKIDEVKLGDGKPGEMTKKLRSIYIEKSLEYAS
ncbi:MAG: D-amino-acid transaminase [Rhodobacteraceae bacterium]|nr:D-amino-acid transaminase [Paracoccaceae bacterium]